VYPREHSDLVYDPAGYALASGLVATGAQQALPLPKLASYRPARVGPASRKSSGSLDPFVIGGAAVSEIPAQDRLLKVQFPFTSRPARSPVPAGDSPRDPAVSVVPLA
jgi:hypothetical protein